MNIFLAMIGALAFGIIFYLIQPKKESLGKKIAENFKRLGKLPGRTESQIVALVGAPTSRSSIQDGKIVLQWISEGYHIALIFDNGICDGILHEYIENR